MVFDYIGLTGLFIYAVFCSTSIAISQGGVILALLAWAGKCVRSGKILFPEAVLGVPILLYLLFTLLAALLGVNILHSLVGQTQDPLGEPLICFV